MHTLTIDMARGTGSTFTTRRMKRLAVIWMSVAALTASSGAGTARAEDSGPFSIAGFMGAPGVTGPTGPTDTTPSGTGDSPQEPAIPPMPGSNPEGTPDNTQTGSTTVTEEQTPSDYSTPPPDDVDTIVELQSSARMEWEEDDPENPEPTGSTGLSGDPEAPSSAEPTGLTLANPPKPPAKPPVVVNFNYVVLITVGVKTEFNATLGRNTHTPYLSATCQKMESVNGVVTAVAAEFPAGTELKLKITKSDGTNLGEISKTPGAGEKQAALANLLPKLAVGTKFTVTGTAKWKSGTKRKTCNEDYFYEVKAKP